MKMNRYINLILVILSSIIFFTTTCYGTVKLYICWDGDASFPDYFYLDTTSYFVGNLDPFNASILNSSWPDNGIEEVAIINNVNLMVREHYFDFDIEVVTSPPSSGNYQQVGVDSDADPVVGLANNIDDHSNDMDYARVWAGEWATYSQFQGLNATVDRFSHAIARVVSHEAAHNYGCYHSFGNPTAGEHYAEPGELPVPCQDGFHVISPGSVTTPEEAATIDPHFSTTSYRELALNIGLKLISLTNSDFVNTNNQDAHDMHIIFYSTENDLHQADNYYVTFPFGAEWHGRRNPFQNFTTTAPVVVPSAEKSPLINEIDPGTWYEYEAQWSNPDVPVSPGYMIHLGVSYGGAEIFVKDAFFTDAGGNALPSRPVLLAHNSTYDQPSDGGSGYFYINIHNLTDTPVLIYNMSYMLSPRLVPMENLVFDPDWMVDPNWNLLCGDERVYYQYGQGYPAAVLVNPDPNIQQGPCGEIGVGETIEIPIENATQLVNEVLEQANTVPLAKNSASAYGAPGAPDINDLYPANPQYLKGLFPDTYVILQYELIPFNTNINAYDTSNPVRQVVEIAGINPLGEPIISSVSPAQGKQGETLDIIVAGRNFLVGADLEFSGTGITVERVTVIDSETINARLSIADDASNTFSDIKVINPHTQVGVLENAFRIVRKIRPILPNQKPYYPSYYNYSAPTYYYSPPTYNYFNYNPVQNIVMPMTTPLDTSYKQKTSYYNPWPAYYNNLYGSYGLYGGYYGLYSYFPWYTSQYYPYKYPSSSWTYTTSETHSVIGNSPYIQNYTFGSNYSGGDIIINNTVSY